MAQPQGQLRKRAAAKAAAPDQAPPAEADVEDLDARREQSAQQQLKKLIERMAPEMERTLPKHIPVDRLVRISLTMLRQQPDLLKCTPQSFMGSLMTCAQLGVEPGPPLGHAHIVPFWNRKTRSFEATFILGYRGIIDLALRGGKVRKISAHTVYSNEVEQGRFRVRLGGEERIEHDPIVFGDRGEPVGYYAVAWLANGQTQFARLTTAEVEKYRRRSATQKEDPSGPWVTDYQAMALKTCVRRLGTWIPQSLELAAAIAHEDTVRQVVAGAPIPSVLELAPPPPQIAAPEPESGSPYDGPTQTTGGGERRPDAADLDDPPPVEAPDGGPAPAQEPAEEAPDEPEEPAGGEEPTQTSGEAAPVTSDGERPAAAASTADAASPEPERPAERPAPARQPKPVGPGKVRALQAAFGSFGLKTDQDRGERLAIMGQLIGRHVESTKDLTDAEASALLEELTRAESLDELRAQASRGAEAG